jgi:hypothetical protein
MSLKSHLIATCFGLTRLSSGNLSLVRQKCKGKQVKLTQYQAVEAHRFVRPWGSHIFYTIGSQMAVRLSALRTGRHANFCQRLSRSQGYSAAGKIRSTEESNDLIGNRTSDLPACSIMPQPTTLPRAPLVRPKHVEIKCDYKVEPCWN